MTKHITIVSATGYGGTGSSVITDLLSEINGICSLGNEEYWFCQKPHGLSDLEFKLNEGRHRSLVASAIEKFTEVMLSDKELLNLLGKEILHNLVDEFVKSIVDVSFRKKMSFDELGYFQRTFYYKIKPKFFNIIYKIIGTYDDERCYSVPEKNRLYSCLNKPRFDESAKNFTRKIFTEKLGADENIVAVDQLAPVNNIGRYSSFFDTLITFVIDRDPRDLFLLNKTRWKGANYLCNTDDVSEFINWFRATREDVVGKTYKNVYFYNFEDFVYKYDNTVAEIFAILKLSNENHIRKAEYFDPKKSRKNTLLYEKSDAEKYESELRLIEKLLPQYLWR